MPPARARTPAAVLYTARNEAGPLAASRCWPPRRRAAAHRRTSTWCRRRPNAAGRPASALEDRRQRVFQRQHHAPRQEPQPGSRVNRRGRVRQELQPPHRARKFLRPAGRRPGVATSPRPPLGTPRPGPSSGRPARCPCPAHPPGATQVPPAPGVGVLDVAVVGRDAEIVENNDRAGGLLCSERPGVQASRSPTPP